MTDVFDTLLKFIIIGDAAVGKSAILHRFIENRSICTASIDYDSSAFVNGLDRHSQE
jgi:GTPase SAR1 family protein